MYDAGANFLNRSNVQAQSLQNDLRVKANTLNQYQQRNLQSQSWVDRNTNELGQIQQGFDLEQLLADTMDWTDMSQPLTPGPWSDGYIFAPSTPNGSSSDSFTLPSNQVNAAGIGVFSLEEMAKRGWGSQLNVARTPMDKINMQLGLGAFAEPIGDARVDTRHFAPLLNEVGSGVTMLSAGFSVFGAAQSYYTDKDGWDFGDGFREIGKVGVDLAAAVPSLASKASYLTRFNPAGVAYTAADLAIQLTPDYTIQYGQYAGETRSGWTKLMYMNADQQQKVMNVSPELHYELYIRKQPKF